MKLTNTHCIWELDETVLFVLHSENWEKESERHLQRKLRTRRQRKTKTIQHLFPLNHLTRTCTSHSQMYLRTRVECTKGRPTFELPEMEDLWGMLVERHTDTWILLVCNYLSFFGSLLYQYIISRSSFPTETMETVEQFKGVHTYASHCKLEQDSASHAEFKLLWLVLKLHNL